MFMKFDLDLGDAAENAQQKICLNLKNIEEVQQTGMWRDVPVAPRPGEVQMQQGINIDFAYRPIRRQQDRNAPHRNMFVSDAHKFMILLKSGKIYHVKGNFDEFCDTLMRFRERMETVE